MRLQDYGWKLRPFAYPQFINIDNKLLQEIISKGKSFSVMRHDRIIGWVLPRGTRCEVFKHQSPEKTVANSKLTFNLLKEIYAS